MIITISPGRSPHVCSLISALFGISWRLVSWAVRTVLGHLTWPGDHSPEIFLLEAGPFRLPVSPPSAIGFSLQSEYHLLSTAIDAGLGIPITFWNRIHCWSTGVHHFFILVNGIWSGKIGIVLKWFVVTYRLRYTRVTKLRLVMVAMYLKLPCFDMGDF